MKLGIRQTAISAGVFCVLLMALVSLDERVRDRFGELVSGSASVSTWTDRVDTLAGAVSDAVRHQSLENAPLLVFATVASVLVLFMVRT